MKKYLLLNACVFLTLFLSCEKDDNNDTLPPATQTGAGTFGCKINGKNFVHDDGMINCFYQYVDGGYYFGISGDNYDSNPVGISLGTINKTISEGEILPLIEHEEGNAGAGAFFRTSGTNGQGSSTNSEYSGELVITKYDNINRIVSGTFWFDVQHPVTGERIEIRDGRFDSHF